MATATFLWQDYLVFSLMLAFSSAIGLFFGIRAKRKKRTSADEMLIGGHNLPMLPVALSLSASFTSATTIMGIPAEVYSRGGEQWLWVFGLIPCFIFVALFVIPIFYRLQLTSAYEYLELRFNKLVRLMGSTAFAVIILIYMAVVLYAPAVALSQVTGLSKEISILAMGLVCTFYTSIGGIRAVVWTDAFQLLVVWVGLLALMFKGASDVGGWTTVWDTAQKGSRLPRFDMDPNPFVRHTFWTLLIGGGTNMMTVYGSNQANLQRYLSVRSLKESKLALLLNLPLWIVYLTILCLLGLVMYTFFIHCDPLTSGVVSKKDQLLPFFVMQTMGGFPGLPGLFVASIFSASISTLSSGINALAAVTLEDLIKPGFKKLKGRRLAPDTLTFITILLVVIFGALTIGLAYLASLLGKTALTISFGVFGMVGGPLLGLILSGIFIPFMNSAGAVVGMLASLIACFYVGIDPVIHPPPKSDLPLDISGCNFSVWGNTTTDNVISFTTVMPTSTFNTSSFMEPEGTASNDRLYLSYLHYSTFALLVSILVGMLVSALTGCNKGREVDERTYYNYSWCCSGKSSSSYSLDSYSSKAVSHGEDNLKAEHKFGIDNKSSYAN